MDISQFLPQLIAIGILIALVTGFICFRVGRAVGVHPVRKLERELEGYQQESYSKTRINNEGEWVDATLTSIYSIGEAEPGFTNYTVTAVYVEPQTGTSYDFSYPFIVNDDSQYANERIAELRPGQTIVSVLVVLNTDLYWMARPW